MSDLLNEYVLAAALTEISHHQVDIDQSYLGYEETFSQIDFRIQGNIPRSAVDFVLGEFVRQGILLTIGDEAAGTFYKFDIGTAVRVLQSEREKSDSLFYKYGMIGPRFLTAALAGLQEEEAKPERVSLDAGNVPASDRIVSLNHNEISELDERTSEIIDAVEDLNSIDGHVGLRELLIGQLKAGRELIRAGSIKFYVLQVTLIESLKFLATRYEKEAIGALAAALLTALGKHLGIDA